MINNKYKVEVATTEHVIIVGQHKGIYSHHSSNIEKQQLLSMLLVTMCSVSNSHSSMVSITRHAIRITPTLHTQPNRCRLAREFEKLALRDACQCSHARHLLLQEGRELGMRRDARCG